MVIYTRTGDKGKTSLFNGQRVSKADLRVEAYGTVDELNSAIGIAIAEISNIKYQISNIKNELVKIQSDLFEIGSALANVPITNHQSPITDLYNRVKEFESLIDKMTDQMPALSNFILPGGGKTGSLLHFARTVARRAERKVVALSEAERVDSSIIMYLNRLSDLLFTMARFVNYKENKEEVIWTK